MKVVLIIQAATERTMKKPPKYRRHAASGLGFVSLPGKDKLHYIYFGKYEDPDSERQYWELISKWEANGRCLEEPENQEAGDITIARLCELFLADAQKRYVKNESPTSHLKNIRLAIRVAREAYGDLPAKDFTAVHLRKIRRTIIDEGKLCRAEINRRCRLIGQIIRWSHEEGYMPAQTAFSVSNFKTLNKGEYGVKDHPKVTDVKWETVEATLPFLSRQCAAMVLLQWHTGMRPGEVCIMRACDIDEKWDYRPVTHKLQHHEAERVVYLPPQAREIITPWIKDRTPEDFLFSPREVMAALRPRPAKPKQQRKRRTKRRVGSHYSTTTYCHAIRDACLKAKIEVWHPHMLRHSFATRCDEACGPETARLQCGHTKSTMTERYIHRDREKIRKALDEMI
jgi:integrase